MNAAQDAGLALAEPDHLVHHALAQDRFGHFADGYIAAVRGHLDLDLQRHIAVEVNGGRQLDVDAHILVLELRVDQRADRRGGGAGLVRAGGDRNAFADLHRRLLLVGAANARIVQNLGVRVVQQYIELGRTDGDCKIRGLQVGQIIKRRRGGCGRPGGATGRGGRGRLQGDGDVAGPGNAEVLLPVLAQLQNRDVHHHLGTRLVQVVNQFLRQQQLVRRAANHDGVLAGDRVGLGIGQHIANGGLHVGQVVLLPGVRQVEGLDRLLIQLGALGFGVLCDKNRVVGDRPPEGVRDGAHNAQRIHQRHAVQVHLNALRLKVGVKENIDSSGLADGLIDHLGVLLHVQGHWLAGDRLELGRRAHRVDLLLDARRLGKAGLGGGGHLAVLLPQLGDLLLGGLIAGVNLGRAQKLRQRLRLPAGLHQLAAFGHVQRRIGHPYPVEGGAAAQILGVLLVGLLIVVEGSVVVLARLGVLGALEEGLGRLGVQPCARQAEDDQNGQKRHPKSRPGNGGSRKNGCGGSRSSNAAFHRTPRRLRWPALAGRPVRAALAAPDANLDTKSIGRNSHPTMPHFSKAPLGRG